MRQDLGIQTHRNTFYALRQKERELDRHMNRLVLTSVIGLHPLSCLGIKNRLEGELRKPRLNITGSRSSIAGKDVSPVTLTINEQIFLPELNESITDRGIAVRMVLHGLADDIGNLVVLAVIDRLHGM